MKQKSLLTTLLLIIGLGAYTVLNTSYSSGFGSYQSNCNCHGGATGATTVAINAPTFYTPGASYPVTVTVTNTSTVLNQAGFQVQTNIGTLSSTDPDVTIQGGNMSAGHNKRKAMVSNTATFNLTWTAPNPGGSAATFNAVGNAVNGSGTGGDQWNSAPSSNIALPVNFTNVTAKQLESHILIDFETSSEINVQSYSIERSLNGNNFETIGTLSPNGEATYSYRDFTAKQGALYYYRIKESSLDNVSMYSKVVKAIANSKNDVLIYPTIIEGNSISIAGIDLKNQLNITLYNTLGGTIFSQNLTSNVVEIPNLTTGFYFVAIKQNGTLLKSQKVFRK